LHLGGLNPSHGKARREPVASLAGGGGQSPTMVVPRRKAGGPVAGAARREAYGGPQEARLQGRESSSSKSRA